MFPDDFDEEKMANIGALMYMILVGVTVISLTVLGIVCALK